MGRLLFFKSDQKPYLHILARSDLSYKKEMRRAGGSELGIFERGQSMPPCCSSLCPLNRAHLLLLFERGGANKSAGSRDKRLTSSPLLAMRLHRRRCHLWLPSRDSSLFIILLPWVTPVISIKMDFLLLYSIRQRGKQKSANKLLLL